jgi:F0F1-type ATP synthase membrane subunit b/b'
VYPVVSIVQLNFIFSVCFCLGRMEHKLNETFEVIQVDVADQRKTEIEELKDQWKKEMAEAMKQVETERKNEQTERKREMDEIRKEVVAIKEGKFHIVTPYYE